jgi:anaerobic selenocysteine-containing dehydrogenase
MKGGDKAKVARRDFLRALGAGAGVAAAGGVAAPVQAQTASTDDKRKSLYRETEHIKTFYRVNRYPAKR